MKILKADEKIVKQHFGNKQLYSIISPLKTKRLYMLNNITEKIDILFIATPAAAETYYVGVLINNLKKSTNKYIVAKEIGKCGKNTVYHLYDKYENAEMKAGDTGKCLDGLDIGTDGY